MEDLESLLEPYGITDLATVHRMIAQARQQPVLMPSRADGVGPGQAPRTASPDRDVRP